MKVQFHIYFSKKTQSKFERCKLVILCKVVPVLMKLLRAVEAGALALAVLTACGMESADLMPVVRTFCISLSVIAAAELLYRIFFIWNYEARCRVKAISQAARHPVIITQHTYRERTEMRRLARIGS